MGRRPDETKKTASERAFPSLAVLIKRLLAGLLFVGARDHVCSSAYAGAYAGPAPSKAASSNAGSRAGTAPSKAACASAVYF